MITVDYAEVSHIPQIKQVLYETWQDAYRTVLSSASIDKISTHWHSADVLRREIEDDSIYSAIAKSNLRIVGVITANVNDDSLIVSRLYVLPSFQRRGIGELLLNSSFSVFPMVKQVRLEVEKNNPVGVAFYCKHGFSEVKEIEHDVFGSSVRSIVMERRIFHS